MHSPTWKSRKSGLDKSLISGGLLLVFVAPLGEELLFRGILLRGFIPNYGRWKGIACGAAFFAAMHLDPAKLFGTFVIGLVFGWWFANTRNIWMGVFGHAFNNGVFFLSVWFWPESLKAGLPAYSSSEPLLLLAGVGVFCAGIWWIRRCFASSDLPAMP